MCKDNNRKSLVGLGAAVGIGVGTAIGVATRNMELWMMLGGGLGAVLGGVNDALRAVRHR